MRGDRIVLPIPPGTRWSDPMPVMIQTQESSDEHTDQPVRQRSKRLTKKQKEALLIAELAKQGVQQPTKRQSARFGPPGVVMPMPVEESIAPSTIAPSESIRPNRELTGGKVASTDESMVVNHPEQSKSKCDPKRSTTKCDPKVIAAARELRDRYLEQINSTECALMPVGKYELSKPIESKSLVSTSPDLLQIAA